MSVEPADLDVVVLRVAALSVEEGVRLTQFSVNQEDAFVRAAVALAADSELLAAAKVTARAAAAVRRYVTRMSSRATPFGLLAGACAVPIGRTTQLTHRGRGYHTASASIDMAALEMVVAEALKECDADAIPLRPNPTLRRIQGGYRYRLPGDETSDVIEVRATPAIAAVIAACADATMSRRDIAAELRAMQPTAAMADLDCFVCKLVERGLLIPDTGLLAPGAEPAAVAATLLRRCGMDPWAAAIHRANARVKHHSTVGARYLAHLEDTWRELSAEVPPLKGLAPKERYHVEMRAPVTGTVGRHVMRSLERATARLEEIFPPVDLAADFRQAFQDRYGDATISLLEAADPEHGVLGRGKRSRSRIAVGIEIGTGQAAHRELTSAVQVQALSHWIRTGEPFDLGGPETPSKRPVSTAILGALIDPAMPAKAILLGASPRSPAALLARFSFAGTELSGRLRREIQFTCAARGGEPDAIAAEVIYGPGGRIGNVLVRPMLCGETIALTGATRGTMALDRLLLRIEGEHLAVYDKATSRPVVLFLSSAHGTEAEHLDPLYRLLANISQRAALPWSWGALAELPHLPRVCCGDVIVAPERWRLHSQTLKDVVNSPDPAGAFRSVLPGLGDRRWLGIGEVDQRLAIDSTRPDPVVEILGRYIRHAAIDITEIPQVEHPAVGGRDGRYVAEVVIDRADTLRRRRDAAPLCAPPECTEWVYFEYFCGVSSSEHVITAAADFVAGLRNEGVANLWFFVRYGAGGNHIRVRVRAAKTVARGTVISAMDQFGAQMLDDGTITCYRMANYVPEVRRYGGWDGLLHAERLFSADSDDVAARLGDDPAEGERLITAARDICRWWTTALSTRVLSAETMRLAQRNVGLGGRRNSKAIGKIVRDHMAGLGRALQPQPSLQVETALGRLVKEVENSWGKEHIMGVVGSAVHMHCNRLFAFDQRRMEYLAYELAITDALRQRYLISRDGPGLGKGGAASEH